MKTVYSIVKDILYYKLLRNHQHSCIPQYSLAMNSQWVQNGRWYMTLHPVVSGKGNPYPHPWASRTCLSIWIPSKLFNVLPIEWSCYMSMLIGIRLGVKLWLEFYEPQSKLSYYTLFAEKLLSKTDNIRRLWYDRAYVPNWFTVPYQGWPSARNVFAAVQT